MKRAALLLDAWVRLLLVDLGLRVLGAHRTARLIPVAQRAGPSITPDQLQQAHRYARWLRRAARHHLVRAECLHQSLALHGWLRGAGIPSTLEIGVHVADKQLLAHAWVRIGNHLVGERPCDVAPFVPLAGGRGMPWP